MMEHTREEYLMFFKCRSVGETFTSDDWVARDLLFSEIARLRGLLEPFAILADKFPDGPIVEISEPHPDNPSPHIEPFTTDHFRRAKAALPTGAPDGR